MVVADSRFPRDGRFLEILGIYHPQNKVEADQVRIDETKALKWLSVGAQPSDTCRSILRKQGILKKFHETKVEAKKATAAAKGSEG